MGPMEKSSTQAVEEEFHFGKCNLHVCIHVCIHVCTSDILADTCEWSTGSCMMTYMAVTLNCLAIQLCGGIILLIKCFTL